LVRHIAATLRILELQSLKTVSTMNRLCKAKIIQYK
jgi:hypothetical protein